MMAHKSRNQRKQPSTRALTVRYTFEVECELQDLAAALFGKIRASRYAGVVTRRTSPFVMGVIVGSGSEQPSCLRVQAKFPVGTFLPCEKNNV